MITDKPIKLIVEALVFASDKPISVQEIQACLPDETLADIRAALDDLKAEYDEIGRSFIIKDVAQGFQFRTLPDYSPYILRMFKTAPARLSRAALETLAIIAYKQPILRHEIEKLRGVDTGGIIRTLMEKGLIKIVGRKNLPGKPLIYGTTKKFLEVFDLKDIESLPKLKEIKELGGDEEGTVMPLAAALSDETPAEDNGDEAVGEEDQEGSD